MKSFFILLITSIAFGQSFNPPDLGDYTEGTITSFSEEERSEIETWKFSTNSKLKEALLDSEALRRSDAYALLHETIQEIVSESYGRKESFIRFALNRGLFISNIIQDYTHSIDNDKLFGYQFLRRSIKVALKFSHDSFDFNVTKKRPYAQFGFNIAEEFLKVNSNILNKEVQFRIYHKIFEMLAWDLFHDKTNQENARLIIRIHKLTNEINPNNGYTNYLDGIKRLNRLRNKVFVNFGKNEYETYLKDYNTQNFQTFMSHFYNSGYFTNTVKESNHYSSIVDEFGRSIGINRIIPSKMRLTRITSDSFKMIVRPKGGNNYKLKFYGSTMILKLSKKDGLLRVFQVEDQHGFNKPTLKEISCRYRLEKRDKNTWSFENIGRVHFLTSKKKAKNEVDILEICPLSFDYDL